MRRFTLGPARLGFAGGKRKSRCRHLPPCHYLQIFWGMRFSPARDVFHQARIVCALCHPRRVAKNPSCLEIRFASSAERERATFEKCKGIDTLPFRLMMFWDVFGLLLLFSFGARERERERESGGKGEKLFLVLSFCLCLSRGPYHSKK